MPPGVTLLIQDRVSSDLQLPHENSADQDDILTQRDDTSNLEIPGVGVVVNPGGVVRTVAEISNRERPTVLVHSLLAWPAVLRSIAESGIISITASTDDEVVVAQNTSDVAVRRPIEPVDRDCGFIAGPISIQIHQIAAQAIGLGIIRAEEQTRVVHPFDQHRLRGVCYESNGIIRRQSACREQILVSDLGVILRTARQVETKIRLLTLILLTYR